MELIKGIVTVLQISFMMLSLGLEWLVIEVSKVFNKEVGYLTANYIVLSLYRAIAITFLLYIINIFGIIN